MAAPVSVTPYQLSPQRTASRLVDIAYWEICAMKRYLEPEFDAEMDWRKFPVVVLWRKNDMKWPKNQRKQPAPKRIKILP